MKPWSGSAGDWTRTPPSSERIDDGSPDDRISASPLDIAGARVCDRRMTESSAPRPTYTAEFIPSTTRNAVFLGNPILDGMMHSILALGAELWADKRRLKIIESLLTEKREVSFESIEHYVPTPEQEKAWTAERDLMIKTTFGALLNGDPIPPKP